MLWQGAKWRILKNFNVQNEECHNYEEFTLCLISPFISKYIPNKIYSMQMIFHCKLLLQNR
jgi:hypothetical protein